MYPKSAVKPLTEHDIFEKYYEQLEEKHYMKKLLKKEAKKIFLQYMREFNTQMSKRILNEAEELKLPFRLGRITVQKKKRQYKEDSYSALRVNHKASKDAGARVCFNDDYYYKWNWAKARTWQVTVFKYLPCRDNKRGIGQALSNGKDFFL